MNRSINVIVFNGLPLLYGLEENVEQMRVLPQHKICTKLMMTYGYYVKVRKKKEVVGKKNVFIVLRRSEMKNEPRQIFTEYRTTMALRVGSSSSRIRRISKKHGDDRTQKAKAQAF